MDDFTLVRRYFYKLAQRGMNMIFSVYLIDDEMHAVEELRTHIPWQQYGMQVIGFNTSPEEGLKEAKRLQPNVVFSDMKMPGMDGAEFARELLKELSETEIVIVSAWSEFEYVRAALREGCFDYLLKPLREAEYAPTLERLNQCLQTKVAHLQEYRNENPIMQEIQKYLRIHLQEKVSLGDLSEHFHLSQNAVCSYFNRYLQTTFVSYLTSLRMKEAQTLLLHTQLNIKEIATRSGYDDYFYFCRVFQRTFHCTPTQLRLNAVKDKKDSSNEIRS